MSTIITPARGVLAADQRAARRGLIGLYMQLTKARLSALVLLTTAVGFMLACGEEINWRAMWWTMLGTALAAGCASVLNQIAEVDLDRRMNRTRHRPLPSGALGVTHSFVAAMIMGAAGLIMLASQVNLPAAWLALTTILIYVLLYTPLKVRSTLNTIVGAVCGAIPPMIGWVAAKGSIEPGAWVLGGILFVWQIPHFFALAWLYRDDYARGGFAMLPVIDREGRITCQVVVLTAAAASIGFARHGDEHRRPVVRGRIRAHGPVVDLVVRSIVFASHRCQRAGVFIASITYLPVLMILLVVDRGPIW